MIISLVSLLWVTGSIICPVPLLAGEAAEGHGGSDGEQLAVNKEKWSASYHISYIGDADSQFQRIGATAPVADSATYHSLEGSYRFTEKFVLRGGVNNLFDEDPPYYTDPIDQNTDPFTYDLLGRRYFVKLSYQF